MKSVIVFDSSLRLFLKNANPLLLGREDQYNGILGTLRSRVGPKKKPLLVRIVNHRKTRCVAVGWPGKNLIIGPASAADLRSLVDALSRRDITFRALMGSDRATQIFARLWSERQSTSAHLVFRPLLQRLDRVKSIPEAPGSMKIATLNEVGLLRKWLRQFENESIPEVIRSRSWPTDVLKELIRSKAVFFWVDARLRPVAMAQLLRPTPNGIAIGGVYTPPADRNCGYATSLVAKLSETMLRRGKKFCVLFTDVSNPTSNRIYRRIGYKPILRMRHYVFGRPPL